MNQNQNQVKVHIGGSNRKCEKQFKAFAAAGIELIDMGQRMTLTGHLHLSNRIALMPDTPEARSLLKKVGGSIARDQPSYLRNTDDRAMF